MPVSLVIAADCVEQGARQQNQLKARDVNNRVATRFEPLMVQAREARVAMRMAGGESQQLQPTFVAHVERVQGNRGLSPQSVKKPALF